MEVCVSLSVWLCMDLVIGPCECCRGLVFNASMRVVARLRGNQNTLQSEYERRRGFGTMKCGLDFL